MWDWLLGPIDPSRAHEVGTLISWHARTMVLAWGILAPLAVMIARFFKVLPSQNWPGELDNPILVAQPLDRPDHGRPAFALGLEPGLGFGK